MAKEFKITFKITLGFQAVHPGRVISVFLDVATGRRAQGFSFFLPPADTGPVRLGEWFEKTADAFERTLAEALIHETYLHLTDIGDRYLDHFGIDPDPATRAELVERHVNKTRERVSRILRARGARSKWTKAELEQDVTNALRTLRGKHPTLEAAAEILRREKPKKAPASGEALGALLKRFGLSWRTLKTDT